MAHRVKKKKEKANPGYAFRYVTGNYNLDRLQKYLIKTFMEEEEFAQIPFIVNIMQGYKLWYSQDNNHNWGMADKNNLL